MKEFQKSTEKRIRQIDEDIDYFVKKKEKIKDSTITPLLIRIGGIEKRIEEDRQYLQEMNVSLIKHQADYDELDEKHQKLIDMRRVILAEENTKTTATSDAIRQFLSADVSSENAIQFFDEHQMHYTPPIVVQRVPYIATPSSIKIARIDDVENLGIFIIELLNYKPYSHLPIVGNDNISIAIRYVGGTDVVALDYSILNTELNKTYSTSTSIFEILTELKSMCGL